MHRMKVLIIDDQKAILESLGMYFSEKGHEIVCAESGTEGLKKVESEFPDIVILDIRLPDMNGLDILRNLKSTKKNVFVIMITAFHDMETTIRAMKNGAYDYIYKPINIRQLENSVRRIVEAKNVRDRVALHKNKRDNGWGGETIIGKTPAMQEIFKTVGLCCDNRSTVLIKGESGTGKELIAKAIHNNGILRGKPFVGINCCALVETLLESELFGHEKGAFTGAYQEKKGKFEIAENGTIFLDEVGDMPVTTQAKLLRFVQEKQFERVGGKKILRSDARIIAATNKNLRQMVNEGEFREDLYFRLNVVTITVPPLRSRRSDIPLLIDFFVAKSSMELCVEPKYISKDALNKLMSHNWPGNVRELENTIMRAMVMAVGDVILENHIAFETQEPKDTALVEATRFRTLEEHEKEHIVAALGVSGGNKGKACELLGISRPTLSKKIQKYHISL